MQDRARAPEERQLADLVDYINQDDNGDDEATQGTLDIPIPKKGGRRRSGSFTGINPLDTPITQTDYELSALRKEINRQNQAEEREKQVASSSASTSDVPGVTFYDNRPWASTARQEADIPEYAWQETLKNYQDHVEQDENSESGDPSTPKNSPKVKSKAKMNYQNYIDSPNGPGANPRQAPPSPSQGMNHITNGMNGMGMGGMVGYPTPAGHQSDLNYVMQMVEELSSVLRHNQALTSNVVEKMGKVREKAANMNLTNDEVIALAANELNEDSKNLEKENSELRKALEQAEYDKKENWKLACHGANILADITEKMHIFREKTDADVLAWHKNYRKQLEIEREENLNLRNHILDMKATACRANGTVRDMRRYVTDHPEWHELRVQNVALRQEKRFWKRMALPLLPDDDSEFSDDDDLIDPEEKKRLAALEEEKKLKSTDGEGEVTSS